MNIVLGAAVYYGKIVDFVPDLSHEGQVRSSIFLTDQFNPPTSVLQLNFIIHMSWSAGRPHRDAMSPNHMFHNTKYPVCPFLLRTEQKE